MLIGRTAQLSPKRNFFMPIAIDLHPLCTLFPRMSGYEFECLKLDIKDNGQREPIITHDGLILDGGNRYRACVDLGIEPVYMKFGGESIAGYVLSANLHRRHLTLGQQASIVACVQDWSKAQSVGKPKSLLRNDCVITDTAKTRAKQSGASHRTQQAADRIAKAAPELAAAVSRGEISLPKATEQAFPKPAPPDTEPKYTELDAAHDQIASLQDIVAAGFMATTDDERTSGLVLLADLRKEIKTLRATLSATESQRDQLMTENASIKRQCLAQARKLKKYEGGGNVK